MISLDEGSARRRGLYLTTQNICYQSPPHIIVRHQMLATRLYSQLPPPFRRQALATLLRYCLLQQISVYNQALLTRLSWNSPPPLKHPPHGKVISTIRQLLFILMPGMCVEKPSKFSLHSLATYRKSWCLLHHISACHRTFQMELILNVKGTRKF